MHPRKKVVHVRPQLSEDLCSQTHRDRRRLTAPRGLRLIADAMIFRTQTVSSLLLCTAA